MSQRSRFGYAVLSTSSLPRTHSSCERQREPAPPRPHTDQASCVVSAHSEAPTDLHIGDGERVAAEEELVGALAGLRREPLLDPGEIVGDVALELVAELVARLLVLEEPSRVEGRDATESAR